MSTTAKLSYQLEALLYGNPWYGTPVYDIITAVTFEAAYEKAPGASHSIAEIVLHLLAWTEEAIRRLNGELAGVPFRGDWPESGAPTEEKWAQTIGFFKTANTVLLDTIQNFPEHKWSEDTNDNRNKYTGAEASYEALVIGMLQHHIYHAGQIALLNKMING